MRLLAEQELMLLQHWKRSALQQSSRTTRFIPLAAKHRLHSTRVPLACPFCVVPRKEGKWRTEKTIAEIWRGGDYPRELILLDNDFFGPESRTEWRERIRGDSRRRVQGQFQSRHQRSILE
jgi:hypothetical protein